MACREITNYHSTVDMWTPVVTEISRKLSYRFMATEPLWMIEGRNDLTTLTSIVPRMAEFSDDGFRLQGAYGPMFVEQVRYVVDTLKADPNTRQAVMTFWRPNPRPSRDVPCTVSLQFLVRNGTINTVVTMRSSDAWLGWPYDIFTFTMLTMYVALQLPTVIASLGQLHLNAGSQHLYERDLEKAHKLLADPHFRDISDISIHNINTPDHLCECLRNIANNSWGLMSTPFLPEIQHFHNREKTISDR